MKLRIEISEDQPDEVVIHCASITDEVLRIRNAVMHASGENNSLPLKIGDVEYFVPVSEILFFETDGDKVAVHTAGRMYGSDKKLYELERMLPPYFVRVSKSCILDSGKVSSISKGLTGSSEVTFYNSYKKTYVSRMYYKALKEMIYETRLSK